MANFRSRYHEKDKTLIIIYSSENKLVSFRFVSSTRSADSTIFHILLVFAIRRWEAIQLFCIASTNCLLFCSKFLMFTTKNYPSKSRDHNLFIKAKVCP